jgi:hypothetical protein
MTSWAKWNPPNNANIDLCKNRRSPVADNLDACSAKPRPIVLAGESVRRVLSTCAKLSFNELEDLRRIMSDGLSVTEPSRAVFPSYAARGARAARRICDANWGLIG